jgi:hypothetical protein
MAWLLHRFVERPLGPRLRYAVGAGLVRARDAVLRPVTSAGRLLAWSPGGRAVPG